MFTMYVAKAIININKVKRYTSNILKLVINYLMHFSLHQSIVLYIWQYI